MNRLRKKSVIQSNSYSLKKVRYVGINLTQEAKELYCKSYKTLKKEVEEDTRGWKDLLCSRISRINIVKMVMPLKPIQIQCNPYKSPIAILHRNRKINPKIHMKV
jgi:hypothetical protein